jgi:LasA protease
VNRRSGPGTSNPIVGSVADGDTVTLQRTATGDALTGRRGTTDAWSELADGTWVSDAFLWTGATPG